ncbi:signal peptide, CUB and EGF-like domain-containing protein 1 [Pecten maximus]|uniref:signal peptide, CUB and EGF-like domain-containing protein 1 n=1 Tax=Pecten maximus TaxID=6579 RepID=UPI0014581B57|nr:signal peptide, CUB and EGF-like domain-containing protein 1 [Pecten maximus]
MNTSMKWTLIISVFAVIESLAKRLEDNVVHLDLRHGVVRGFSNHISFISKPTTRPGRSCDKQVVLKLDFSGPYKEAKIVLDYAEPPRLWTLDISDSPTGDGYGDDNGTTSNMAETQIHNKQFRIYGNNLPGHMDASANGGLLITTVDNFIRRGSKTKISFSDERVEWKSGPHRDNLKSRFLYTLRGQQPLYGEVDYNVYVGLNRVVAGNFRSGSGLCSATITMYSSGNACETGTHTCDRDAICINTRRRYKCRCKPGFYGTGKICVDENECDYENGGCVHFCQNQSGNYTCSCKEGFVLDRDGHNCIDKNECLENLGGCAAQCVNTLGSYECRCNQGYSLAPDGRNCQYGTYCKDNLQCQHFCHTPAGKLVCGCREGFRLHSNALDCIQTCAAGNGGCQHNCTDGPLGPICSCAPKYILRDDNHTCIASCEVNNGGCDRKCIDTKAGPQCSCPRGFKLHQDDRTCLDIDECQIANGGCSNKCVNTKGGYECVCPKGFKVQPDHHTCTDVDECELNTTCDQRCVNTPGTFHCTCKSGFQLYGITHCADMNECAQNNGGCQHSCENTEGGFRCHCPTGFKLHTNRKDCVSDQTCLPIRTPAKSSMACVQQDGDQVCTVRCDTRTYSTSPKGENVYRCGTSTGYEWLHRLLNQTLSSCSESAEVPVVRKTARILFMASKCRVRRSIREEVRRNITAQLELKKYRCRRKCSISSVNIDCDTRKSRRLVQDLKGALVAADIEIEVAPLKTKKKCDFKCTKKRTERRLKKLLKRMKKFINKSQFVVSYDGDGRVVIKKSFKYKKTVSFVCPEGKVMAGDQCVACSVGSYFKRKLAACSLCSRGTYQDQEGQTSCIKCPNRIPGVGILGAKTAMECTVLCEPGTFSHDGLKPCTPCHAGTYGPEYGRTSCFPCGGGLTTSSNGATTFSECSPLTCSPGHFYDVQSHTCQQCPTASYQPDSGQTFCYACPGSTITDSPATTNSSECKDASCGGMIGRLQGFIQSPNYPGNYPNNIECVWRIKPSKKRRILVIIPEVFLPREDQCGDSLVMRKSKKASSLTTYEACESTEKPIAFTSQTHRLWIKFKSDGQNSAGGFSIPFVTYNEDYQQLIEDIVRDGRLYDSYQHQSILKDRKMLSVLMEVIAQPYHYFKYANASRTMMPESFIKLLTSKVTRFLRT